MANIGKIKRDQRINSRKSTVREVLISELKKTKTVVANKLRGRFLFRSAIRRVIEYLPWITADEETEEIGDDVTTNVKFAQRKKRSGEKDDLTIKDRAILFIPAAKRTEEQKLYLKNLLSDLKAFKRYPDFNRDQLATEVGYQFVPAGRTIIRQGHDATLMYYIVKGQLKITKTVTDSLTGETSEIEAGNLVPGDMFGEIALMHEVPRSSTVVTQTHTDLFIIKPSTFDKFVRDLLEEEWDTLQDALLNFNYFKGWSDETMRECCILSKIVNYKSNEILLGDGKGLVHYVYFILSGECRLIEHMIIEKNEYRNKTHYKLYDRQADMKNPRQRVARAKKNVDLFDEQPFSTEDQSAIDYIKMLSTKKASANIAMERISVITVTLQDVLNQWHEITDTVEMLMKQPSSESMRDYPENVQTIFMQICIFYRGACFGLGEQMRNRRVVSITPTKCLLIPRFWLTEHNRANIWERVKHFMNSKYPSNKELLDKFVDNRTWLKYKKELSDKAIQNGRKLPNDTKNYDVPYSIRIIEEVDQ